MTQKEKYSNDGIQGLSQREWFKLKLFNIAEIDPLYVIIGFLQEYSGGYSLDNQIVDSFFVNEYEKAVFFNELCEYYLASLNSVNDVELIKLGSGHSYVQSKLICEKLKEQFLFKEPDNLNQKCFKLSKENDLFKTAEELYGDKNRIFNFKKYSYLLGVIIKNKLENRPEINFANASYKAQLTIEILKEFSAFGDDSLRVDYFFGFPEVTRVILSENNTIWNEIVEYKKRIQTTG